MPDTELYQTRFTKCQEREYQEYMQNWSDLDQWIEY